MGFLGHLPALNFPLLLLNYQIFVPENPVAGEQAPTPMHRCGGLEQIIPISSDRRIEE